MLILSIFKMCKRFKRSSKNTMNCAYRWVHFHKICYGKKERKWKEKYEIEGPDKFRSRKAKIKTCLMFCKIIIKGILMTLKEFNAVKKIACATHKKILFGFFVVGLFLSLYACLPASCRFVLGFCV